MSEVLKWSIFYFVFLGLFIWFEGQLGVSDLSQTAVSSPSYDLTSISWFEGLLHFSSKYWLLNTILLIPFTIGLIYVLVALLRGVSP